MSEAVQEDVAGRVLDVATRLFAAQGYDGTSLSAIADEVGIRKPSLLYHYSSKEELRHAVLRRVFSHWNDVLPRILQVATTGTGRFDALVGEVVAFFVASPDRARLLLREMLDRPDALAEQMGEYVAPWISIMADYLRRGQAEGSVHADLNPEAFVRHVILMIVAGVATTDAMRPAGTPPDSAVLESHVRETIRIARAALFIDRSSSSGAQ